MRKPLPILDQDDLRRFWEKVARGDSCWLWTAAQTGNGYGTFKVDGNMYAAHRIAYLLAFGPPEEDVLHRCGTPLCVRPEHLYDGDAKANARDRIGHGTHPGGEMNPRARLTETDVRMIRSSAEGDAALAARFGVAISTIYAARTGLTWRHLAAVD